MTAKFSQAAAAPATAAEEAGARSIEDLLVAMAALCEAVGGDAPPSAAPPPSAGRAPRRAEEIPNLTRAETTPSPAVAAAPVEAGDNGNSTVLIVEDDAKLRELMTTAFRRAGFIAHAAENGRRALRLLEKLEPDLMVTDIVMPEMEGIATLMAARGRRPGIGVVAISGGGAYGRGETYLDWASRLGADEVLPKPFRMSALLAAARVVLAGRAKARSATR